MDEKKRIFSGMRPTGKLHYGHMAGALINWVKLQNDYNCFWGIVDWHAMMSDYADSGKLKANCREILLDWLAVGVDPEKSSIFIQSHVKQHAELHLALSMITPLGWLERCPTYKEQILNLQNKDLSTYAFLGYPVLMAGDILLYKSWAVPSERTRARILNLQGRSHAGSTTSTAISSRTGDPAHPDRKDARHGRTQMSKSYGNALDIADDMKTVWDKLRTMTTDPARERRTDPGTPEKCPVWDLHKFFNKDAQEMSEIHEGCMTAGIGCVDCKKKLMVHLEKMMGPIQERRAYYEGREDDLKQILESGAARHARWQKNDG